MGGVRNSVSVEEGGRKWYVKRESVIVGGRVEDCIYPFLGYGVGIQGLERGCVEPGAVG